MKTSWMKFKSFKIWPLNLVSYFIPFPLWTSLLLFKLLTLMMTSFLKFSLSFDFNYTITFLTPGSTSVISPCSSVTCYRVWSQGFDGVAFWFDHRSCTDLRVTTLSARSVRRIQSRNGWWLDSSIWVNWQRRMREVGELERTWELGNW